MRGPKPLRQTQSPPAVHWPLPQQSLGHRFVPQSAPSHPGSQMHCPWKHTPWPLHDFTQPPASKRSREKMGVERRAFAAGMEAAEPTDAACAAVVASSASRAVRLPCEILSMALSHSPCSLLLYSTVQIKEE